MGAVGERDDEGRWEGGWVWTSSYSLGSVDVIL